LTRLKSVKVCCTASFSLAVIYTNLQQNDRVCMFTNVCQMTSLQCYHYVFVIRPISIG